MVEDFLIHKLPTKGPDAFRRFIEVLVTCNEQMYIAEKLDPDGEFRNAVHPDVPAASISDADEAIKRELTGFVCACCFLWLSVIPKLDTVSQNCTVRRGMHALLLRDLLQ